MTKVKKVFSGVWVVIQVAFALVVLVFALLLIGSVILAGYGLYLYRHEIVIFIFTISLLALIGSLWLFVVGGEKTKAVSAIVLGISLLVFFCS